MKISVKLFSVLIVMIASFAFGQSQRQAAVNNPTNQTNDTRFKMATMLAETKDNLSVVYSSGMTYETFRSKALGRSGAAVTQEGEALLTKVYNYLKSGTSNSQIIASDDGKDMNNAFVKLNKIGSDGSSLFSAAGSSDIPKLDVNFQTHQNQSKGSNMVGCKWYQIACWIDDIFGAGTAAALMKVLIAML